MTDPPALRAPDAEAAPRPRKRGRRYYKSGFYALKTTLRALGPASSTAAPTSGSSSPPGAATSSGISAATCRRSRRR